MNKYTRRGQLVESMQRALRGGFGVKAEPHGVVIMVGKIRFVMKAEDADNFGFEVQAEAEEWNRLYAETKSEEPAAETTP